MQISNIRIAKKGPTIRDIHITPIAIGDPPLLNAAGLHAPYALRTIVEIVTDDNISGISEIPGNEEINIALEETKKVLVGRDPFNLNQIKDQLLVHYGQDSTDSRGDAPWDQRKVVHIFSAIEVACLDILGKIIGRPVVDLIGGKRRESVPFAAYLFYKHEGAGGPLGFNVDPHAQGWAAARQDQALEPAGIVQQAEAMCSRYGFKSIKLKGGVFEPQLEVDAILALHEAFGDAVPLRLDPNAVWKIETALQNGRQLEGHIEYLEDPVRGQKNMARVRKALRIPLATNMCTTSFDDIPGSVHWGSEDIILSDHHFWGGLRASMNLARICQTFGKDLSMHSNSHLGISLAAMVHLGAAIPKLNYALDTHYPWQSDEVISSGRFKFESGQIAVPTEPGLGVTLDRVALAKLHQNYLNCGLTKRDDELEMQKVKPGWKFRKIRW